MVAFLYILLGAIAYLPDNLLVTGVWWAMALVLFWGQKEFFVPMVAALIIRELGGLLGHTILALGLVVVITGLRGVAFSDDNEKSGVFKIYDSLVTIVLLMFVGKTLYFYATLLLFLLNSFSPVVWVGLMVLEFAQLSASASPFPLQQFVVLLPPIFSGIVYLAEKGGNYG